MKKTTPKTTAAKAAAPTSAAPKKKAAPVRKKAAATGSPVTSISAKVDIGFGNHLYLRGEGPGLSWDHGIAMDCMAGDLWTASLKDVKLPVSFKVLINDQTWSSGNDYVVAPGQSVTVIPTF